MGNQLTSTVRSGLGQMALRICYWSNYANNMAKLTRKSENDVNSYHVLKFTFGKDLRICASASRGSGGVQGLPRRPLKA